MNGFRVVGSNGGGIQRQYDVECGGSRFCGYLIDIGG